MESILLEWENNGIESAMEKYKVNKKNINQTSEYTDAKNVIWDE